MPFVGADGFCSPVGANWRSIVTSEFGGRIDPITGKRDGHTGMDLAVPAGTPVRAALDIDLDRSEFSMLDTEGGCWLKYAVPDVLSALWHSQRNPSLTSEQQQTIFDSRLDGLEIFTTEAPTWRRNRPPRWGCPCDTSPPPPCAPVSRFPRRGGQQPAGETGRDTIKCPHIKGGGKSAAHLSNYVKYAATRVGVDSKLKRQIREKKIAMGHKPDDHEEQTMG